jgi:uncharacterized protein with ACT and thioredoxin-like domain
MKWILPILFLLANTLSYGQSKDSVVCLPKNDILKLANKIQRLQDTLHWQKDTIVWQGGVIIAQDTLISSHKQRALLFQEQLDNRQKVIGTMEEENKKLRETIDLLMPKWYNNKWIWLGGGATVATIILGLVL